MPKTPANKHILSYDEVLRLLSEQARDGSVTALATLERALRRLDEGEGESVEDELERILTK